MAYIANKPIRFDRDYKVGEIIPDGIIDPAAEKRLLLWGKITKTDFSEDSTENEGSTHSAEVTAEKTDSTKSEDSTENENSVHSAKKTAKNKKAAKE